MVFFETRSRLLSFTFQVRLMVDRVVERRCYHTMALSESSCDMAPETVSQTLCAENDATAAGGLFYSVIDALYFCSSVID